MRKILYLTNLFLFLFLFISSVYSFDIPTDEIKGPLCVLKDTVTNMVFPLSPARSQYNVIVTDGIAQIDITQLYVNEYENINSIVYVFPLPHRGSVNLMEMEYHDSLYKAEIYEKEEAQHIYDSIQKEGGVAALLIQDKPNIFQQKIANIATGDSAVVRIRVSMPLTYNNGIYELAIPTMVAPRYAGSAGTGVVDWNPPENRDGQKLQINVLLQTGYPISNLNSPTHPFVISQLQSIHTDSEKMSMLESGSIEQHPSIRNELEKRCLLEKESVLQQPYNQAVLLAESSTYPNRDYVLRFSRAESKRDYSLSSFYDTTRNLGHFALNIFPDDSIFYGDRPNLEIILLIDISGSQSGWPLRKEKEATLAILNKLKSTDRFTVMSFENSHDWLWAAGEVREATSENITFAESFVNGLYTKGSTELLSAVDAILKTPASTEHKRVFVFLTDGFINNEDAVFDRIKREATPPTIFTFGAGGNLNRYFLDKTAEISNGVSYEMSSSEDVNVSVDDAWGKIETAQLKNITIDWGSVSVEDIVTPQGVNLYRGKPITVFGSYKSGGATTIKIKGYRSGAVVEFSKSISFATNANTSEMIPQIWAKQKIDELVLEDGAYGTANKSEIINLSVDYQVLSKYTAFLAINPQPVTDNSIAEMLDNSFSTGILSFSNLLKQIRLISKNGFVQILFPVDISVETVQIFDIRGRLIHSVMLNGNSIRSFKWDGVSGGRAISSGWYIMRIKSSRGVISKQFRWSR